jgi:hypothetical protein
MMTYRSTYNVSDPNAFYVHSVTNKKHQHNYLSINITNIASYQFWHIQTLTMKFIVTINRCSYFIAFNMQYSATTTCLHRSYKALETSLIMQLMNITNDKKCKKLNFNLSNSIMHTIFLWFFNTVHTCSNYTKVAQKVMPHFFFLGNYLFRIY